MKIRKKDREGKWYKYKDGVEFQIRPFKFSSLQLDLAKTDMTDEYKEKFMSCLTNWKGIVDEDNKKEFEYTPENKELIFDYYNDVREFIIKKMNKAVADLGKSVKN